MRRREKGQLTKRQIVRLYADHSINQIAELDGTKYGTIHRILRLAGVKFRQQGHNGIGKPAWCRDGFTTEAAKLGMSPERYVRLLAVLSLGGRCVVCGNQDLRVLQINHVNGESRAVKSGDSRKRDVRYTQHVEIIFGRQLPVEIRCANCNILHEYERGTLREEPILALLRNPVTDFSKYKANRTGINTRKGRV